MGVSMRHARRAVVAAAALALAVVLLWPHVQRADAGDEVCTPCVVVIEVDGLEAKDVTPQTTPFLWALAHSGRGLNAAADTNLSPVALGAAQVPGIGGRNGFIWQAARGVMTATTAASTASLLTGGYPGQS